MAQYRRITRRRGPNKATVAVAHSIIVAAWHVLSTGQPYHDPGGDYFERRQSPEAQTTGRSSANEKPSATR